MDERAWLEGTRGNGGNSIMRFSFDCGCGIIARVVGFVMAVGALICSL